MAILIPKNIKIDLNILSTKKDTQGRILIMECKLEEKIYILVNIYPPTRDKPNEQTSFLSKLREMLQNCNGNPLIIGGDFNTCVNIIQDKRGGTFKKNSVYSDNIKEICEDLSLVDIWRVRNKTNPGFTGRQKTRAGLVQ